MRSTDYTEKEIETALLYLAKNGNSEALINTLEEKNVLPRQPNVGTVRRWGKHKYRTKIKCLIDSAKEDERKRCCREGISYNENFLTGIDSWLKIKEHTNFSLEVFFEIILNSAETIKLELQKKFVEMLEIRNFSNFLAYLLDEKSGSQLSKLVTDIKERKYTPSKLQRFGNTHGLLV